MATRTELVEALRERYQSADRASKGRVLDEFVAVTGFHRKHAMRLLRAKCRAKAEGVRPGRRVYDEAVRTALVMLWEAADRLCGKRLRPLIPILLEAMERHGHLDVAPEVKAKLTQMSAATIDRALREVKVGGRSPRRQGVAGTALRRSVPVRTFSDWDDPAPGYIEADLVSHSGPVAKGSFAWTFTLTDIATGWTECAPLLVREQTVLIAVLNELRRVMPFAMLGFDTDNDSVFINETVRDYCAAAGIAFTRCRPYRKNDQAWVEQKNGSVVRRLVGYRRFEGIEATAVLADLYAAARLFVNFFQPSFKLAEKRRDGARVHKRYHAPATPCQRLLDDPRTDDDTRERLRAMHIGLDPVQLLRDIRVAQQRLVALTDTAAPTRVSEDAVPELDAFLSGLRIAWKSGEARPTATAKPKAPRGRRRPDPLVNVTAQLKRWFEEEPWRTGRELLEKLQAEQPGDYPGSLLRTVQRRLKIWRREHAHALVFSGSAGPSHISPATMPPEMVEIGSGRPRGVRNIVVRQRHGPSGTSLSEAIGCAHRNCRWVVRVAFALDCCDREAMGHVATTGGITAEDIRDLMVATVEHRFGPVNRLASPIEWLSDNGSPYVAHDTRRFARDIGLVPRTTPVSSPQSNGMAEAFVRTLKRDYVRVNPTPDARTVMEQLPRWLAHYNEVHPHKALGYRSPRVYITQTREASSGN